MPGAMRQGGLPTSFWLAIVLMMMLTSSLSFNAFQFYTCGGTNTKQAMMAARQVAMSLLQRRDGTMDASKILGSPQSQGKASTSLQQGGGADNGDDKAVIAESREVAHSPPPAAGAGGAAGKEGGEAKAAGEEDAGGKAAATGGGGGGGAAAPVVGGGGAYNDEYAKLGWQWQPAMGKESAKEKKILLDLGANCGNSYKKLQNVHTRQRPQKRPFDISYLFEWNPRIIRLYLNKLAETDPGVKLIPHPAWGVDKTMTFYADKRDSTKDDAAYLKQYPCTSTKVNTFNSPEDSGGMHNSRSGEPIEVNAIGFPGWFVKQDIKPYDQIFLKVDIEGAECSVLDAWMDMGLTCSVQEYYVEWHDVFSPELKKCATITRNRLRAEADKCKHKITIEVW